MTPGPAALLDVDGVTAAQGGVDVLVDASVSVEPGQVVGVVGPNGAGKTTLLRVVLGLHPLRAGRVSVAGWGVRGRLDPLAVAHVPQRATPDPLFPAVVEEVVWMGRYPHLGPLRRPRRVDVEAVERAMALTGIAGLARRPVHDLSGGEQRRVAIARAMAQTTPLLLLDEPYAGVDAPTEADLRAVLGRLAADGVGILLVDHDLHAVAQDCDVVVLLNRTVRAAGPPATVLDPPVVAAAYGVAIPAAGGSTGG